MRVLSSPDRGFSLVESLIACTLLTIGVLSLAHLFGVAAALNVSSRDATLAAVLAVQKLEELRTAVEQAPGVDFVDARGGRLPPAAGAPPPDAAYVRRWTVDPLDVDPANTTVLQVTVSPTMERGPRWREVRMVSVRTRKSP
jgi:type II secretory pathway pseudopilin PulG